MFHPEHRGKLKCACRFGKGNNGHWINCQSTHRKTRFLQVLSASANEFSCHHVMLINCVFVSDSVKYLHIDLNMNRSYPIFPEIEKIDKAIKSTENDGLKSWRHRIRDVFLRSTWIVYKTRGFICWLPDFSQQYVKFGNWRVAAVISWGYNRNSQKKSRCRAANREIEASNRCNSGMFWWTKFLCLWVII